MEELFEEEFRDVRVGFTPILDGGKALAVTSGRTILFDARCISLPHAQWEYIVAHELSHIVQQRIGRDSHSQTESLDRSGQLQNLCESEAQLASQLVMEGIQPRVRTQASFGHAQAFKTFFEMKRPFNIKNKFVSNDAFRQHVEFNLLCGHESITKEAFDALSGSALASWTPALKESLGNGNRHTDVPESMDVENDSSLNTVNIFIIFKGAFSKEIDSSPPNYGLAFDSSDPAATAKIQSAWKKFQEAQNDPNNQVNHFMATPGKSNSDSYKLAKDYFSSKLKEAEKKVADGDLNKAAVTFGEALHALQDSFSEAHVRRDKDTLCMKQLFNYAEQVAKTACCAPTPQGGNWSEDKHTEFDMRVSNKNPDLAPRAEPMAKIAIKATAEYLQIASQILSPGERFVAGVKAALDGIGKYAGKTYFFKGSQYVSYDWTTETADNDIRSITAWKLPAGFESGIDAALNGRGAKYANKAYFFKGDQYVRYDWTKDSGDKGYPLPITLWKLPAGFESGIDAAINGQGVDYANKAYFFKGDKYVRYDWATETGDTGYPLQIATWKLVVDVQADPWAPFIDKWLKMCPGKVTANATTESETPKSVKDSTNE